MNHDTMKEAAELLQQARRENDRPDQTTCARRNVLRIVIRVLIIVLGELAVVGCSGGVFRSSNYNDAGEQWSSDSAVSESTISDAAAGGSSESLTGGTYTGGIAGASSSLAMGGSGGLSSSGTQVGLVTGGSTFEATGGALHDPGECPCPQNNACQVSASGCNVPGTKGNEGNETFTCVVSPLHCATAARPVFCFQC